MRSLKSTISKISLRIRRLQIIRKSLRAIGVNLALYPSGHYYSPIIDTDRVLDNADAFIKVKTFAGIELHEQEQLILINELSQYYSALKFNDQKTDANIYHYDNPFFSYSDAITLHLMMVHFRPQKIIEIGSGYSTACMLDTVSQYDMDCHITSIDQDTSRLAELISKRPTRNIEVINNPLQELEMSLFSELKENDILFVDSSHISKTGSELHKIIFEILPTLQSGVIIHFHDIFQNFEYPKEWIDEGISFNEAYLLRAFLQYNSGFKILLFLGQLQQDFPDILTEKLPLSMQSHERYAYGPNKGRYIDSILGQSLYIVKQ